MGGDDEVGLTELKPGAGILPGVGGFKLAAVHSGELSRWPEALGSVAHAVKEKVTLATPNEAQKVEGTKFFKALDNAGVNDWRSNNVVFGTTESNATPRWILIE